MTRRDKTPRKAGRRAGEEVVVQRTGEARVDIDRIDDLIEEFAGSLRYPPGYLDGLRDEWER